MNEGFKYWFKDENLATVWSAPNYCYRCGNKASILELDENYNKTIQQFDPSADTQNEVLITMKIPNYFM